MKFTSTTTWFARALPGRALVVMFGQPAASQTSPRAPKHGHEYHSVFPLNRRSECRLSVNQQYFKLGSVSSQRKGLYGHDSCVTNATTNTPLFFRTVTARKLFLCWKGKPSSEDISLPTIDHTDLFSSFHRKCYLNYRPIWKLWSTAPPGTS